MASNNPQIPYVEAGKLYQYDGVLVCKVGATLWLEWLEAHKSFAFTAASGARCSVIKERRVSSSGREHFYWYAYRSIGGEKRRVSLGVSGKVDLRRLTKAVAELSQLETRAHYSLTELAV